MVVPPVTRVAVKVFPFCPIRAPAEVDPFPSVTTLQYKYVTFKAADIGPPHHIPESY